MRRKKFSAVLCLYLFVMLFPAIARSFNIDDVIYEAYDQLLQKYPNVEAIRKQFGDRAVWREETEPSPHDNSVELKFSYMEYPGIEIQTLEFALEEENRFYITFLNVEKAGFVNFGGIDIGSASEDVINLFGVPHEIEGNELIYLDESGYTIVTFTIENQMVAEMAIYVHVD